MIFYSYLVFRTIHQVQLSKRLSFENCSFFSLDVIALRSLFENLLKNQNMSPKNKNENIQGEDIEFFFIFPRICNIYSAMDIDYFYQIYLEYI